MDKNINVIFFDLFFTLVTPKYNELRNENDVLKITKEEWELYAELNKLNEFADYHIQDFREIESLLLS